MSLFFHERYAKLVEADPWLWVGSTESIYKQKHTFTDATYLLYNS